MIPASRARALVMVSSHSACGSESATIPPPVWTYARPPVSLEEQEDLGEQGFPDDVIARLTQSLGQELDDLLSALGQPV